MNRILDEAIGGWKAAFTVVAYSGFPVNITNSSNNAYQANQAQRPNQYRKLKIVNRSINQWVGNDPSTLACTGAGVDNGICAYGNPANGSFGNSSVGTERGPGFKQFDASLFKDFTTIREQMLTFRVDATNVFNVTGLGNPQAAAQSGSFGAITSTRSVPRQLQLSAKY